MVQEFGIGMTSLKQKTFSGVTWQMAGKILQKVISVATFAILARILQPSTFGLFALAFTAIDGFHIFKSFGFDTALIQRREDLEGANNTAFFVVQVSGILLCAVCYLAAPFVAHFFHNQDLLSIIRALGIIFIFNGFSRIPSTLLAKEMRFNVLSVIDLIGGIVNCIAAVGFALISPTIWSLVGAYILKQLTIAVLTRQFSGFRIKWRFNFQIAKELLHFGKFMVGLGLLNYVVVNLNNIIAGKILGVVALGYYALAANIGNFINSHFTALLENVMFPAYASIQSDLSDVKRAFFKTTKFVSILSLPFGIALILLAKEFVTTLYGVKWLSIVPLIQIFGAMQLLIPILICSGSLFLGCGKPRYNFDLTFYPLLLKLPLLILFAKHWGILGIALSEVVILIIFTPVNIILVRKIIDFGYGEFLAQFLPSIYGSVFMAAALLALKGFIPSLPFPSAVFHHILPLLIYSLAGLAAYLAAFFLMDRPAVREIVRMLKLERA